jgi:hypothetical protein
MRNTFYYLTIKKYLTIKNEWHIIPSLQQRHWQLVLIAAKIPANLPVCIEPTFNRRQGSLKPSPVELSFVEGKGVSSLHQQIV